VHGFAHQAGGTVGLKSVLVGTKRTFSQRNVSVAAVISVDIAISRVTRENARSGVTPEAQKAPVKHVEQNMLNLHRLLKRADLLGK
jgi:hypothetical protein